MILTADANHSETVFNYLDSQQILPKITVITTCYNHVDYIEATLKSVINQGYPNLEYIVIDGGSTDGSQEIIEFYRDCITDYFVEPNTLQVEKLIKGFARATGDILCMLNSDDLFEPNVLHEVAIFFQNNPQAQVVYGNYSWIDTQGNLIKRKKEIGFNRFIYLYNINYIPQPSTFWRRNLYDQVGGLNPEYDITLDFDLWIRFADITQIYHVHRFWSNYRIHPLQKSQNNHAKLRIETEKIRRRYIGNEPNWSIAIKSKIAKCMRLIGQLFLFKNVQIYPSQIKS